MSERLNRDGATSLSAVVVETRREDSGPRQRQIAHLATLQVWHDADKGHVQLAEGSAMAGRVVEFWEKVRTRLNTLELTDKQREKIEASVAATVPHPTPEQAEEAERFRRSFGLR